MNHQRRRKVAWPKPAYNDDIKIRNIKRGDLVWECERGQNVAYIALGDAFTQDGWTSVPVFDLVDNKRATIGERDNPGAYGLRLYSQPQYAPPPDYQKLFESAMGYIRQELSA